MRRRVSGGRKRVLNPSEALELFLDALCNTLGVIMFLMLVIVVFAKPPQTSTETTNEHTINEVERLAREALALERQVEELAKVLAAMPPVGDASLVKRWSDAWAQMAQQQAQRVKVLEELRNRQQELLVAKAAATEVKLKLEQEQTALQEAQLRLSHLPPASQFVRLSRLQPDTKGRKPVLLLLSGGRLSRPIIDSTSEQVSPPPGKGMVVGDARTAELAFKALVPDADPRAIRLNIGVWQDSFGEYKHLETLLSDLGYALNPLPVASGAALKKGTGGIQ
ncbi:MAG: hypothetical protein EXS00_03915 [Phycisphaerales bacterium]|nr:hypothetical protein [Phycisphaerales bacterium]